MGEVVYHLVMLCIRLSCGARLLSTVAAGPAVLNRRVDRCSGSVRSPELLYVSQQPNTMVSFCCLHIKGDLKRQKRRSSADEYAMQRRQTLTEAVGDSLYPANDVASNSITHTISRVIADFDRFQTGEHIVVAGRVKCVRKCSKKLVFVDIVGCGVQLGNISQTLHVMFNAQSIAGGDADVDQQMNMLNALARGDIILVAGTTRRSKTGDAGLLASRLPTLLAPSLRVLPNPHTVLANTDKRLRRPVADLLARESRRQLFLTRSRIISDIRQFLVDHDFVEVETPILSGRYGGATARPFVTASHALGGHDANTDDRHLVDGERDKNGGTPLFMRIAPELDLKRAIVGGLADRVFEIGKQFRNEAIDRTHNPEFTSCEFYAAYEDSAGLISVTEKMMSTVVEKLNARAITSSDDVKLKINYDHSSSSVVVDFAPPYGQIDYVSALTEAVGGNFVMPDLAAPTDTDLTYLTSYLKSEGQQMPAPETTADAIDKLFAQYVEPKLVQPTIVTGHPHCMSPLAKRLDADPTRADRFELFVVGQEIVNAYAEQNDPEELAAADPPVDSAFIEDVRFGMPPTAGWGMGVDRFVAILTNQASIRDVLLFPVTRNREDAHRSSDGVSAFDGNDECAQ